MEKFLFFWGVGVDPCRFGKCLTDTRLKCVKARKNSRLLRQLVSLTQPLKLSYFVFSVFCLSSSLPEESMAERQHLYLSIMGVIQNSDTGIAPYIPQQDKRDPR